MKNRIKKLEEKSFGTEPTVCILRTLYEGKDGEIDSEYTRASVIWASGKTANAVSEPGESHEAFCERVESYKKLTWQHAQTEPGLTVPHAGLRTPTKPENEAGK